MEAPPIGFVAPGGMGYNGHVEASSAGAFCFQNSKLEPNSFEGIDPLISGAQAPDTRLDNGLSAGEGVFAVSGGWYRIPNDVIGRHGATLKPCGIAVLNVLCLHADTRGQSYASVATMANEIGMSARQVRRELDKLVALKLIRVSHRPTGQGKRHETNIYTLTLPAISADSQSVPNRLTVRTEAKNTVAVRTDSQGGTDSQSPEQDPQNKRTTTETPPNGGGALPALAGNPSEMTATVEAATGRTFEPDPVTAAIVAGAGDPKTDTETEQPPKAKRVDVWAPFKERWRRSLSLRPVLATWQFAQKSVAVAKDNGLTPADASAAWDKFEAYAKAANEWRFVTRQTADERFARWLGQESAAAAVAYDASGWEVRR